jgi:hypothetical protein
MFPSNVLRTVLRTRTRTRIPAHAQAHPHTRTQWQLGKADRAWEGWCPAVCVPSTWRNVWRCAPFLATLSTHCHNPEDHIVLVAVAPAPQFAVHIRQPRSYLRGCRPRVTRTPSRVQATTLSMTERPVNHETSQGPPPPPAPRAPTYMHGVCTAV